MDGARVRGHDFVLETKLDSTAAGEGRSSKLQQVLPI